MVTERVITLPTEPTEGEIVKSHPLFSFINIGQIGRNKYLTANGTNDFLNHSVQKYRVLSLHSGQ